MYKIVDGKKVFLSDIDSDLFKRTMRLQNGYVMLGNQRLHRIVMQRILDLNGDVLKEYQQVDHIDLNRQNNDRRNLRLANNTQNTANQGVRSNSVSGYKGVNWSAVFGKWHAVVVYSGRSYDAGYWEDRHDAARAYNRKAVEVQGAYAYLNVLEDQY